MSGKKLAVLVVHGMGSQGLKVQPSSNTPTFSKQLHKRVRKLVGAGNFDENVAWREVVWADVMQERQKNYLSRIKRKTRSDGIRAFMLCNISDAASYQKTGDEKDNTYEHIHDRVKKRWQSLRGMWSPARRSLYWHILWAGILCPITFTTTKRRLRAAQILNALKPWRVL